MLIKKPKEAEQAKLQQTKRAQTGSKRRKSSMNSKTAETKRKIMCYLPSNVCLNKNMVKNRSLPVKSKTEKSASSTDSLNTSYVSN